MFSSLCGFCCCCCCQNKYEKLYDIDKTRQPSGNLIKVIAEIDIAQVRLSNLRQQFYDLFNETYAGANVENEVDACVKMKTELDAHGFKMKFSKGMLVIKKQRVVKLRKKKDEMKARRVLSRGEVMKLLLLYRDIVQEFMLLKNLYAQAETNRVDWNYADFDSTAFEKTSEQIVASQMVLSNINSSIAMS